MSKKGKKNNFWLFWVIGIFDIEEHVFKHGYDDLNIPFRDEIRASKSEKSTKIDRKWALNNMFEFFSIYW
jgi:hypothetical protein